MPKKHVTFVCLAALLLVSLATVHAVEARRISVYAPQAVYQVDILLRDGVDYVGLTDLLEPLGRIESRIDGKKLKLTFNGAEAEFQDGKRQCRIRAEKMDMSANFVLMEGRGYVPVSSVAPLLLRLAEQQAEFRGVPRRLFVGGSLVHYSAELQHQPSRLVLNFSAPVNPSVQLEKNRVRLIFRREGVVGNAPGNVSYSDPLIQGASFQESSAGVELDIGVLQPATVNSSNGGRTLTISAAAPPPSFPQPLPSTSPQPAAPQTGAAQPRAAHPHPFVILDAAHGGTDNGEMLSPALAEKTVTLSLVRRLQKELEARGIAVVLSRAADNQLTWDQRAVSANTCHATLYVALHASSSGNGVRFYSALLPVVQSGQGRRSFLPWELAQAPALAQSRVAAAALAGEANGAGFKVQNSAVPLRPLNSVTIAAVAVEVAPDGGSADELGSSEYQQKVASALAAGIASLRGKLEEAP